MLVIFKLPVILLPTTLRSTTGNIMLNENGRRKKFYHLSRFAISIKSCAFKCLINLLCNTLTSPFIAVQRLNLHNFSILLVRLLIALSLEHPTERISYVFNHSLLYILPHLLRVSVIKVLHATENVIKEYECLEGSVMNFPHRIISCIVLYLLVFII